MRKKDVAGLLGVLETEFPQSFSKVPLELKESKLNLWADLLADYDAKIVWAAVKTLLAEDREFAPGIGQIQARVRELTRGNELTEGEAWALVSKACSNGLYGFREEFAKLPEIVQKAIGEPEQLREWARVDVETLQTVVASNFQRSYKVTQKREAFIQSLPPGAREAIEKAMPRRALADGEGGKI